MTDLRTITQALDDLIADAEEAELNPPFRSSAWTTEPRIELQFSRKADWHEWAEWLGAVITHGNGKAILRAYHRDIPVRGEVAL